MVVRKKDSYLRIYLKGLLIGVADVIPGISGGTIAFILGIYQRLILAVKNISFFNYFNLLKLLSNKKKLIAEFLRLDILFLFILILGIFSSILSFSHLISYFLENYKVFLLSFFVGLILMSLRSIYFEIENKKSKYNLLFSFFGFIIGFSFVFITANLIESPSFLYVFFSGFLAMFALFLPGISGSFILLLLGVYEYIIDIVKNITTKFTELLPFILGAVVGVGVISRLVYFLFEKDKCKTLMFLLGLVLGSLFVPVKFILEILEVTFYNIFLCFLFFLIGCLLVFLLEKFRG